MMETTGNHTLLPLHCKTLDMFMTVNYETPSRQTIIFLSTMTYFIKRENSPDSVCSTSDEGTGM